MDNTNETSLQIINNKGFLTKIVNFFKNLFAQSNLTQDYSNSNISNEEKNNKSFMKSIKYEEDEEKLKLLKIQEELEQKGISKKNIFNLTRGLSENQKQKLEDLYKVQIRELELSTENCKNKIISMRNNKI